MTYVEKAAAFVRQNPEGVRTRDVAHAVGQDTSNVDGSLRMAKKRGLIERRGRMWFPAGQAAPKAAPVAPKPVATPISMFARKPMIRDLITEVFRANENAPLGASDIYHAILPMKPDINRASVDGEINRMKVATLLVKAGVGPRGHLYALATNGGNQHAMNAN